MGSGANSGPRAKLGGFQQREVKLVIFRRRRRLHEWEIA